MTRAQEFALRAIQCEVEQVNGLRGMVENQPNLLIAASLEQLLEVSETRLETAQTCYGQGEYREAVMALMDS
jgi:uncharacterized NAD-dependent epimerase/dehydratase family protein